MMRNPLLCLITLCTLIILPGEVFAVCFAIYDKSDNVAYMSTDPPFDLSLPFSQSLNSKYAGGHMVVNERCPYVDMGVSSFGNENKGKVERNSIINPRQSTAKLTLNQAMPAQAAPDAKNDLTGQMNEQLTDEYNQEMTYMEEDQLIGNE